MTNTDPRQMTIRAVATVDRDQSFKEALEAMRRCFEGATEEERSRLLKTIDDLLVTV